MAKVNVNRVLSGSKFNPFHWIFFICAFLIVTFDGYDMVVYGSSVPLIMKDWGIKPAYAGVIGTYVLIGAACGSLVFGRIADNIGRKKTILICTFTFSICMIVCGLVPGPISFGIFRVITGFAIGGAMPNIVALATEWIPLANRNLAVTAIYTGMQWGGIMAAGVGLWLLPTPGWRYLYLFGGLTIILAPILWGFLPETAPRLIKTGRISELVRHIKRADPEFTAPADAEFEVEKAVAKSPVIEVFTEGRGLSSIMFIVVYFCTLYMIYGLNLWIPGLMLRRGYNLGSSLTFLLAFNLGCFILNIFTAAIADVIGPRKMIAISYFLGFFAILSLSYKSPTIVLYILVSLSGVFTMGAHNIVHGYVSQYYPPSVRSTGLGLCFGLGRIGSILGPILGGIFLQKNYSIGILFLAFAIPSMINFFAILISQHKYSYTQAMGRHAKTATAH